ncbi:MAG: hypothetical protein V4488_05935 [Pseudomonadota bacterium]
MASTKRTQNKCKSCGYTWYPRGKNISLKCPRCGSTNVGYVGGGLGLAILCIIGIFIFSGNKNVPPPSPNLTESPASASAAETSTGSDNVLTNNNLTITTPPVFLETSPSPQVSDVRTEVMLSKPSVPVSIADNERDVTEEELAKMKAQALMNETPAKHCESELVISEKNSCLAKECAKPEFTKLSECKESNGRESSSSL